MSAFEHTLKRNLVSHRIVEGYDSQSVVDGVGRLRCGLLRLLLRGRLHHQLVVASRRVRVMRVCAVVDRRGSHGSVVRRLGVRRTGQRPVEDPANAAASTVQRLAYTSTCIYKSVFSYCGPVGGVA